MEQANWQSGMNWTAAQAIEHNQKVARGKGQSLSEALSDAKGCEDESELHNQILAECRKRMWIAFHGSMAQRTGRTLGEPDFVLIADGGRVYFIECKTAKGKLTPEQLGMKMWAEKLGHEIHTIRSFPEFITLVDSK